MPAILDTHAWMWWVNGDTRLSKKAKAALEKAQAKDDLFLSMISIWEVAKKVEKKQIRPGQPPGPLAGRRDNASRFAHVGTHAGGSRRKLPTPTTFSWRSG
jgi:PIN domain nuclease of toxin-antitoxin system